MIAFDRDRSGKEMAARIKAFLPNAVVKTPSSVDWNRDLVNSFDWASKNHQREIKRGGGLSL